MSEIRLPFQYKIVESIAPSELAVVMKKGEDSLTKDINQALNTLKENGIYDKLVEKWLVVK